ncbi:calcipressin-1-like [Artemia franciscana]|uniref:calcipressin-1-like n=1 Tax=Artemia franciscana TaxID=6661 RepID=UPI0032DB1A83
MSNFDDDRIIELLRKCFLDDEENGVDEIPNFDEGAEDSPSSLIVTSVPLVVFTENQVKEEFEQLFKQFDSSITVQYLKSFKRARVNFSSPSSAAKARIHIHGTPFEDSHIKCYFIQPLKFSSSAYLQLPKPVKQFLISPPASPPVDWEPISESQPVMNYDLISAIAALGPGQTHELHPQSETTPGIVIHVCEQYEPKEEEDEERQGQITDTRSNFSQILSELS